MILAKLKFDDKDDETHQIPALDRRLDSGLGDIDNFGI